jgi:hypothetical protein
VKRSIEEVARRVNRTPKAIRNMLKRNPLSLREIRCDLFSVESLANALRVRKSQIAAQVADDLDYEFLDVRAVQLDPVDLRGLPRIGSDQTKWVPPEFLL